MKVVVIIVLGIIILIPLPAIALDICIGLGIFVMFLIVCFTKTVRSISLFPTTMLVSTFYNLALNIQITRGILIKGPEFDSVIIQRVSSWITGTTHISLIIGFIIFIVVIAINAVVVVKGSTRISEVAARFTLDSMQVKMMAIEVEFSSGSITEEEAQTRKANIQKESDFFGTMDGASKFVSGNEKVRILLIVVNIIGGLLLGTLLRGEPLSEALATYISLAIGSGIVLMLPVLLMSVAVDIVVRRAVFGEVEK